MCGPLSVQTFQNPHIGSFPFDVIPVSCYPTTFIRITPKNSVFKFPSLTPRSAVVQLSKKHNTKINNACTLPNINFITFRCVSTSHNPQMFTIFIQILACWRLCPVMRITSQMGVDKQHTACKQTWSEGEGRSSGGTSRESNITVCLLHTKGD